MADAAVLRSAPHGALTPGVRRDIERWFVRRGVPQLIEGYSTEQGMDARATPFIVGWLVVGTVLYWGTRPEWPLVLNVAGVIGSLLFLIVAYAVVAVLRGRRPWSRPDKFDLLDIGLFGLLPALPTGLIDGSPRDVVIAALNALLGIGVIYVVIGFGLLEIAFWALGRLHFQLVHIVGLLTRTLPLLLILVVFLLFAAEMWEAAHGMDAGELGAVLVLLLLIAGLLVVTTFGPEIRRLERRDDWEAMRADAHATPAVQLADAFVGGPLAPVRPLSWIQHANLRALVLVNQLLQAAFVAVLVMAFLVVFGLLALPASVQEGWVGEPVRTVARFELLGETRTLSAELLTVTALLSGIVGLYFTGLSLTDSSYRAEHVNRVITELRELMAARALYLSALEPAGGTATSRNASAHTT